MMGFTIGKVAKSAGVGVETIRFYEKKGLIQQPPTTGTYRSYPKSVVARIRFIKRAQELEFTLAEIKELLGFADHPKNNHAAVKTIAQNKVAAIKARITDLQKAETRLSRLIQQCGGDGTIEGCPIIGALIDDEFQVDQNPGELGEGDW